MIQSEIPYLIKRAKGEPAIIIVTKNDKSSEVLACSKQRDLIDNNKKTVSTKGHIPSRRLNKIYESNTLNKSITSIQ